MEGFGAAQCVTLWAKDIVKVGAAVISVDNAGFVYACGNGSSRCEFVYSMAKFIQDMLKGMGVNIKLFHTGRRTTAGERICDAQKGSSRKRGRRCLTARTSAAGPARSCSDGSTILL